MPLEPPDQQYWQAAVGYVELGMFQEADSELDRSDPFCRAVPEVLAVRLEIYRGLKKWELMQAAARKLAEQDPQNLAIMPEMGWFSHWMPAPKTPGMRPE